MSSGCHCYFRNLRLNVNQVFLVPSSIFTSSSLWQRSFATHILLSPRPVSLLRLHQSSNGRGITRQCPWDSLGSIHMFSFHLLSLDSQGQSYQPKCYPCLCLLVKGHDQTTRLRGCCYFFVSNSTTQRHRNRKQHLHEYLTEHNLERDHLHGGYIYCVL